MLRVFLLFAFCLSTAWGQGAAEVPYHNRGVAEDKVIAAHTAVDGILINDIFINDGLFEVQNFNSLTNLTSTASTGGSLSFAAYDMEGMTRYTNNGTFIASSARFDTVDEFGYRNPATTFVNTANGRMDFLDGINLGGGVTVNEILLFEGYVDPLSHFNVNARNIENHGLIRMGAGGAALIGGTNSVTGELQADNVDLKGGTMVTDEIGYVMGVPGVLDDTLFVDNNGIGIGYLSPLGIYDVYWGVGAFTNQNVANFMTVNPTQVISPPHRVTNQFGAFGQTSLFLTDAQSWGFFNQTSPTNINIQAVFVQTANSNVTADVEWTPQFRGADTSGNGLLTAVVKLSSTTIDPLTLQETTKDLFILDQLGSSSNKAVIRNDKFPTFLRPLNYFITRIDPVGFGFGFNQTSNITVTPDLFFGPGFASPVVTNAYSGYSFNFASYVYAPPLIGGGSFSPPVSVRDFPGRWEVRGKHVDLTDLGVKGEGLISIDTPDLVQPVGTIIDAQNLTFNFAFTNTAAPFRFQGLSKKTVSRLAGDVLLWSGVWSNVLSTVSVTPSNTFVTNFTTLLYHTLMVDASQLTQTQLVSVADFNVKAQSLIIQDDMVVSNRFTTTAKDLTIAGSVELRNILFTQDATNFPNLINLTNQATGTLTLVGLADFGIPGRSLSNFVNRGTISSYSQSVIADNVDITGRMISGQLGLIPVILPPFGLIFTNGFATNSGPINITANRSARLTGAVLGTFGNIDLAGSVFKLDHTSVAAGGTVSFDVTGDLQDSGITANNVFVSSNSFAMNTVAGIGNLLGSSFEAQPPPRGIFRMIWGTPTNTVTSITNIPTSGNWPILTNQAFLAYNTNTAIGRLKLDSTTNSIFEFSGTSQGRALFVDTIEIIGTGITNLASLTSQIRLITNSSSSIDIYYANIISTNLQRNLPLGFTNLAEFFNGRKFPGGGTFHWVPNFNGPNSSEDVVQTIVSGGVTNQVTISMNSALRHSLIIDMDGDGIANGNDDFPMNNAPGTVTIASISLSTQDGHIAVQFTAFPGTYSVQTASSLEGKPTWKTIGTYQHPGPLASAMSMTDPDPISEVKRFYRLIYTP